MMIQAHALGQGQAVRNEVLKREAAKVKGAGKLCGKEYLKAEI